MREQKNRRKAPRVPASLIARCCQKDLNEVGMRVHDLSIGGMGIKTNYPLSLKERLAVAFQLKNNLSKVLCVTGEVAWLQYHGDNPGREETFFSGGIKFLNLQESSVAILHKYVRGVVE
jgi:Tfp pilus assembly protein PilZ